MSNAVPPSVTPPSPNEWLETIKTITGITNNNVAKVTCPSHGFTAADLSITSVDFLQVVGMSPINGIAGVIQEIVDSNNFTININTTNFPIYRSAGVINVLTGQPPTEQVGTQVFNTPYTNVYDTNT